VNAVVRGNDGVLTATGGDYITTTDTAAALPPHADRHAARQHHDHRHDHRDDDEDDNGRRHRRHDDDQTLARVDAARRGGRSFNRADVGHGRNRRGMSGGCRRDVES